MVNSLRTVNVLDKANMSIYLLNIVFKAEITVWRSCLYHNPSCNSLEQLLYLFWFKQKWWGEKKIKQSLRIASKSRGCVFCHWQIAVVWHYTGRPAWQVVEILSRSLVERKSLKQDMYWSALSWPKGQKSQLNILFIGLDILDNIYCVLCI